jgi:uncharacterized membrane protein YfcA
LDSLDLSRAAAAFGAAVAAGLINSVAFGGTLITFPTLIWLGLNSITANATSTIAIWPGTVASSVAYRRELGGLEKRLFALVIPSLVGGLAGAWLLRFTPPEVFDRLVPYLILFATLLFLAQERVQRYLKTAGAGSHESTRWLLGAAAFQFLVAVYGGYFGAGIGILMLAAFGVIGLTKVHQMLGLKVLLGGSINVVAVIYFIWYRMVYWPYAIVMIVGSLAGGYGGAGLGRRLGASAIRGIVIGLGFALALLFFIRR